MSNIRKTRHASPGDCQGPSDSANERLGQPEGQGNDVKTAPQTPNDALSSLSPMPDNPRLPWDPEKAEGFANSIREFGDLSGIVKNVTTGELVGGHKRVEQFQAAEKVEVIKETCPKDKQGTVAYGYVIADGIRFSYREVEWSKKKQKAANVAANKWSAEWDFPQLSNLLRELEGDFLNVTGFTELETQLFIEGDWKNTGHKEVPGPDDMGHSVKFTKEQWAVIEPHLRERGASKTTEAEVLTGLIEELLAR